MPQYEMGLRDYWRILRKRKLIVVLACVVTGGLTFLLTQHVFRKPPTFEVTCELSVRPGEVVGTRLPMRPPNVAQQAKVAKSSMLLNKVIWAIEQYPFYARNLPVRTPPGSGSESERNQFGQELLLALEALEPRRPAAGAPGQTSRIARISDLARLFANQATDPYVTNILARDAEQQDAASAGKGPTSGFITDEENKDLRETIISQFQYNVGDIDYDTMTSSFRIKLQTTAPNFDSTGRRQGREAATRLAETLAVVYKTYTEWDGRRAIRREIENIDKATKTLVQKREEHERDRGDVQRRIEEKAAGSDYEHARAAWRAATDQKFALERYEEQLEEYTKRLGQIKTGEGERKTYPPIPAPANITDANIRELYTASTLIEKEKNDKLEFYKTDSHVIVALDDKIERTARQLADVVKGAIKNEEARVAVAFARFEDAKKNLPIDLRAELGTLTQKIDEATASLRALSGRRGQLSLFKEQGVRVDIIGRPGTPEQLGRAGVLAKTIVGAIIGLILGIVVAVLWETLDLTMGTIEEVESFLETRVLGVVPHVGADRIAAEIRARDPEAEAETSDADLHQRAMLVTLYEPKAVSAEAFRHIRTALDFARQQNKPDAKVFLVTSATLYEGKTIVAANLAVVMAQNGRRTCLVECDLRRPQLHHVFGVDRRPGLHDVFIGKIGWEEARKSLSDILLGKIGMEAAVGVPGLENLTLLTCGAVPPNPVELLGSAETGNLFAELRETYDVVIVDSPPILPVADAAVISPFVDGAILVYRAGAAPRTVLSRAKTELESVGTPLFGVVLNDLRPTTGDVSATYPYKGYPRKAYALPDEAAPRVPVALAEQAAVDRAGENAEEPVIRKVDLFLLQGKVEQAVETAHKGVQSLPESMGVRLNLARAYAAAGRVGEAQAELLHVLDMDPRNLPALERLAEMALDAGLEREALRWYEEILDFAPQNAKARERADELRTRIGDAGPETI